MADILKFIAIVLVAIEIFRQYQQRKKKKENYPSDLDIIPIRDNFWKVYMEHRSFPVWFYFLITFDSVFNKTLYQIGEDPIFKSGYNDSSTEEQKMNFLKKFTAAVICCISYVDTEKRIRKFYNMVKLVNSTEGKNFFGKPILQKEYFLFTNQARYHIQVYLSVLEDMEYEVYANVEKIYNKPIQAKKESPDVESGNKDGIYKISVNRNGDVEIYPGRIVTM